MSSQRRKSPCVLLRFSLFFTVKLVKNIPAPPFRAIAVSFGLKKSCTTHTIKEKGATIPLEMIIEKNEKRGLTNSPFSVILNVSKERGINQWNVLIVMKSAERTLNVLNAERGNKNEIH